MAKQITFIHAADLHLGAPLRGLRAASPALGERLARAIPEAYDRLISVAVNRKVDFVVLAGDIFDQAQPSYANFLQFVEGLQKLHVAGIPVYMLAGNHDPMTAWQNSFSDLPPNTYMFPGDRPGFAVYSREGEPLALLGGRGFQTRVVSREESIAAGITLEAAREACGVDAPFAVGVLHTGLDIDTDKAPVSRAELLRSGFDYWALGHIHKRIVDSPNNPRLVFPGCIQGRDIHETGARGCYQVTLTEGQPNRLEFVPLASVAWQIAHVDVSSCATVSDCHDTIMRELFRLNGMAKCEEMVERIILHGATDLHSVLEKPGVLQDLRNQINEGYPIFYCDALIDHTEYPFDRDAILEEGLFPATLLRQSSTQIQDQSSAIAYLQDEFLAHGLALPQSCVRHIDTLQHQAENLVIDLLRGDYHV